MYHPPLKETLCFVFALTLASLTAHATPVEATVQAISSDPSTFALVDCDTELDNLEEPLVVRVGQGDAKVNYEGRRIRGTLVRSDGRLWLERIWPVSPEQGEEMAAINQLLREDTEERRRRDFRKQGSEGINFALFNQRGEVVRFGDFRGQWVMMNFVFTRCRVPEMCPAQTVAMVSIQDLAAKEGIEDLSLITVTLDPEYDTPGVLRHYADLNGADPDRFYFLTGDHQVIVDLLKQYGVIAYESKDIIDHTVTTLLFNADGKIILRRDGTRWRPQQFIDAILRER